MVLAAQLQAQIVARFKWAKDKDHRRDEDVIRERLLNECRRPRFAETARYRKPIGKGIEGMSIRFAEAFLRYYGNVSVDVMTISEDDESRTLRVTVLDLETNASFSSESTIQKTVERNSIRDGERVIRQRTGSRGQQVYIIAATEDDLLNKQNAVKSKAMRTEGLRFIAGDLLDECEETILETLRQKDAQDPDAAKRKIFDSFGTIGVTVQDLKLYLGHEGAKLTPKELVDLRGIFAAIRDGETTWKATIDPILAERGKPADDSKPKAPASGSRRGMSAVAEAIAQKKSEAPPANVQDGGKSSPEQEEIF
jgi:hypothetical protein